MNITINISTGFTLFYILYGTEVALPIDHVLLASLTSVATFYIANMK